MESQELKRLKDNLADERNSALIYQALSQVEKDERIAEVYRRFAEAEVKHANHWEESLKNGSIQLPEFRPTFRTKMLVWLAHKFGPGIVLPNIQGMEQQGTIGYAEQGVGPEMVGEERSHARLIQQITRTTMKEGVEGGVLAMLEGRHRATGGNALRAAVLGANDGLVSNLSLVMGVAGAASMNGHSILITGLAGLLAGACSMALGEWLSVQSSRELFMNQIRIEKNEIASSPEEEVEELTLIYESRGLKKDQANMLASQIMADHKSAADVLAREELGVDPKELGGSAWEAAITSFVLFALGAVIPVVPFMLSSGTTAVLISVFVSTIGLFLIGSITSLFTGRSVLFSGMRMVIFGLIAAAITFGIGHLIGASLGA